MKKLTSLILALALAFSLCANAFAAEEPDDWARAEVDGAIGNGLVPEDLQCNYRDPITRAEFCRLVVQLMRRTFAEDFIEFMEENDGLTVSFTDTNDREIRAAAQLGIVNGVGGGKFNPDGSITRQEAAVMLKRAANILELTPTAALTFRDADEFASWAAEGISFTSALVDPFNMWPVMRGKDNEMFKPLDKYSRQEAMCTMLRIYDNWLLKNTYPDEYHDMFGFG